MQKIKKIFFLLLIFYVNFTFVFEQFHILHDIVNLSIAFVIVVANINILKSKVKLFQPPIILSLLIVLFVGVLSLIVPFIMGTGDMTFFRSIYFGTAQKVLLNLAMIIIFFKLFGNQATFERLIKYYIASLWLYIMLTFLFMLVPGLKNFWLSVLYIGDGDIARLNQAQYFTRIGIDGFAGFVNTFHFALGVVLSVFLIIRTDERDNHVPWLYIISLGILTLGTLFYGRIGSVVAFIAILSLLFYFFTKPKNISKGLTLILGFLSLFLMLLLISLFNESIQTWFLWSFELIISFFQEGEFSSTSTEILFNQMYFIPDLSSFLFGNGLYTDPITGSYFMRTDVSFLRSIMFYGIIPTLLIYLAIMIFIILLIKKIMKNREHASRYLLTLMILTLIIFEIKGEIYHIYFSVLLPLYISASYDKEWLSK